MAAVEPFNCFGRCVQNVNLHKGRACALYALVMALFIVVMSLPYFSLSMKAIVGYSFLAAHLPLALLYIPFRKKRQEQEEYIVDQAFRQSVAGCNQKLQAYLANRTSTEVDCGIRNIDLGHFDLVSIIKHVQSSGEGQAPDIYYSIAFQDKTEAHDFLTITFKSEITVIAGQATWQMYGDGVIPFFGDEFKKHQLGGHNIFSIRTNDVDELEEKINLINALINNRFERFPLTMKQ